MNILIIFLLFILFIHLLFQKPVSQSIEKFKHQQTYTQTNLAALSRSDLQTDNIDLSKIDWSKIDDYTYSQIVCLIQGCDKNPIIKNLPVFTSS